MNALEVLTNLLKSYNCDYLLSGDDYAFNLELQADGLVAMTNPAGNHDVALMASILRVYQDPIRFEQYQVRCFYAPGSFSDGTLLVAISLIP